MRSRLAILAVWLCVVGISVAEESVEDLIDESSITKAKHLAEAAAHLRAAGRSELAEKLIQDAEELIQPALQRLEDKQAEAGQLLQQIADLERKLERPDEITIRVRMLSMPAEKWQDLRPAAGKTKSMRPVVVNDAWLQKLAVCEQQHFVKSHCETSWITRNGMASAINNGGEFPVPVPHQDGSLTIQWREFGFHLNALPTMLGLGRVRMQLSMEHSVREMAHAVELNGTTVPGLLKQKTQTVVESQLGDTVLVYEFEQNGEVKFGLVTPEQAK